MHIWTRWGLVMLMAYFLVWFYTCWVLPRYEVDPYAEWPQTGARFIRYPTDSLLPFLFWGGVGLIVAGWIQSRRETG